MLMDRKMKALACGSNAKKHVSHEHREGYKLGLRKDTTTTTGVAVARQCQKCYRFGHPTYECKNVRIYIARPSLIAELKHPKLRTKLMQSLEKSPPVEQNATTTQGVLAERVKKLPNERKRRRSSSSDDASDDDSDSESSSSSSSSDDSDSSSTTSSSSLSLSYSTTSSGSTSESDSDGDSESTTDSDSSASRRPKRKDRQRHPSKRRK